MREIDMSDIQSYGGCHGPAPKKKYGTYHQAEAGNVIGDKLQYIEWFEGNAPAMGEKLWKIREQFTIATKNIFDAMIELPPMKKREYVSKISEYTGLTKDTVRGHMNHIVYMIDPEELKDSLN